MESRVTPKATTYPALALVLTLTCGCAATYDEKAEYLKEVAQRGVATNKLFEDQDESEANEEVCTDAHVALNQDYPQDSFLETSEEWENLVRETFVSACVSGRY